MRRVLVTLLCAAGSLTLFAQGDGGYKLVPNWPKLPAGMYLGESMGVATNSKGHIFVFNRNGESSRLYEFDQNGAFVHEIGRNSYAFAMAHAVRVDAQDNIWTVDEGTNTVVRWNATDQRPDFILGRRH